MIAPSKLVAKSKPLGYFDSVPYTCYECGHTWEPHCYMASLQTLRDSMKFSIKVYCSFYLFSLLWKLRKKENFNANTFKKLSRDILQSSVFLSLNGTLFMSFFCIVRNLIGRLYGWHGLGVGTLVGYTVINIERKSRRGMLALYLANLACEILFNIGVSRNLYNPVPHGEVYMFIAASAGFMTLFRMSPGLSENLRQLLRFIVGRNEEKLEKQQHSRSEKTKEHRKNFFLSFLQSIESGVKHCHFPHKTCSHLNSCLYYTLKGFLRNFSIGYVCQICLNLLQLIRRRQSFSSFLMSFTKLKTSFLGLFLGLYNGLFRLSNCTLRWLFDADLPVLFGAISGAVAGASAYFYQSKTITMYFLFKFVEVLGSKAIDRGWFPRIPYLYMHVYAISLGIILHAAVLEPHNIRPAYWRFLIGVSGNRFPEMFRNLFDVFGTKASLLYPDFYPDLHPKYVASSDAAFLMKASGKWK